MSTLNDYFTVIDVLLCLSEVVMAFENFIIVLYHDADRCSNFTNTG